MNTDKSYLKKREPFLDSKTAIWPSKFKSYLAGPMEFCSDEGLSWRLEFRNILYKYGINCIIPNEEEKYISGQVELNQLKIKNPLQYERIMRKFIKEDLKHIENSDFVITKWEGERMSGTISEAQFTYLNGIPNYLITSKKYHEIPGWFAACFTYIFNSLNDLILYLETRECKCKKNGN